ncbi:MAG: right-handed parallel beta-helix repeat-containing protein [Myxococcota bacterium]|jgi:hypothetical protein|nr:right-handed parallel beta-helix repeat-containing protein [Myxococcota bacterium]
MKNAMVSAFVGVLIVSGCTNDECQILPERFEASTTLSGCYEAPVSPVIVDGVTITMEPGTTITFARDTGLWFSGDATLIAVGTAEDPILLTGAEERRGFWAGVRFDSADGANRMDYVTVEYAGSTTAASDPDAAAIKMTSDSRSVVLSLSHCTLRESGGWGLWAEGGTTLPTFADNTLTTSTLGAASLDSTLVHQLDAATSYSGNTVDHVVVRASYVHENVTWGALDVPYRVEGALEISAVWTLSPGTTIVMGEAAQITISDDVAAMNAVGTAASPIVITGARASAGAWDAIVFDNTNNSSNVLEHVMLENGGGGDEQYDLAMIVAVSDSHGVTVDVSDCTLRGSAKYAIHLDVYADYNDDIESSNTFADNASGNVRYVE